MREGGCNQARVDLGLDTFSEITSDPGVAAALESVYGSVDNIDVWVGGLAEDHVNGGSVGELFSTIIIDQFERLRAGDANWYQNRFSGRQLDGIESTTLADVIERNTSITGLQANVFFDADSQPVDPVHHERRREDRRDAPRHPRNDRVVSRPTHRLRHRALVESPGSPIIDSPTNTQPASLELQDTDGQADRQSQSNRRPRPPRRGRIVEPAPIAEVDDVFKQPMDLFNRF